MFNNDFYGGSNAPNSFAFTFPLNNNPITSPNSSSKGPGNGPQNPVLSVDPANELYW